MAQTSKSNGTSIVSVCLVSFTLFNFEGLLDLQRVDSPRHKPEYGGVAQLGEHLPCKQGVDSSILFVSTSGMVPLPIRGFGSLKDEVGNRGIG